MTELCNQENMRKWVDALRSGRFPQGRGYLEKNGKFCCLGVLCEVAIENGVPIRRFPTDFGHSKYGSWFHTLTGAPPGEVLEWLGVQTIRGDVLLVSNWSDKGDLLAVEANDTFRLGFDRIADALEKTYLQ